MKDIGITRTFQKTHEMTKKRSFIKGVNRLEALAGLSGTFSAYMIVDNELRHTRRPYGLVLPMVVLRKERQHVKSAS